MSSDKGGSTKTTTTSPYSPEQKKWIGKGLELYGPTLGQGANVYPGARVAPFTPTQQGVFGQLPGFAEQFGDLSGNPLQKQLEATSGSLLAGELGAQPITPEQESAYFGRAVRDPRQREFGRTEAPLIREEFAGPGYWGSARAGEVAEAQGDVNAWLGAQRAQLGFDVLGRNQQIEESQANRALAAISPSLGVGRAPLEQTKGALAGLETTMGMAGMEQQQQQSEIQSEIQKWAEQQAITDPANLQVLLAFLGMPTEAIRQKSVETPRSMHSEDWANVYGSAIAGGLGF